MVRDMTDSNKALIDAGALVFPLGAYLSNISLIVTIVLGILGAAWYCVQFYDRFWPKKDSYPKNHE